MAAKVEVQITAEAEQLGQGARQAAGELNKIASVEDQLKRRREALERLNRRLAEQARQRPRDAFETLSVEDRIARLKEQQARAAERLTRATTAYRRAALQARHHDLGQQITRLQGQRGGGLAAQGVLGYVLGRFGGPVGGLMRSAGGAGLGGGAMAGGVAGILGMLGLRTIAGGAREARELTTQADRLGISTTEMQGLQWAAGQTGLDACQVVGAIERLRQVQGEAQRGNQQLADSFARLGISMESVQAESHIELFRRLVKVFGEGALSAQEFAAAQQLLGQSSKELMSAMRQGFGAEMQVGAAMATRGPLVAQADALQRDIDLAWGVVSSLWSTVKMYTAGRIQSRSQMAQMGIGKLFGWTGWGQRMFDRNYEAFADYVTGTDRSEELANINRMQSRLADRQQARADEALADNTEATQELTDVYRRQMALGAADAHARMGMFVTAGSEAYTKALVDLQKSSKREVEQIRRTVESIQRTVEDAL